MSSKLPTTPHSWLHHSLVASREQSLDRGYEMAQLTLPRELDQALPRRIRVNLLTKMSIVFVILMVTFIVSLTAIIPFVSNYSFNELRINGQKVLGYVVGTYLDRGSHRARYEFEVPSKSGNEITTYFGSSVIKDSDVEDFYVGMEVPVIYDSKYLNVPGSHMSSFLNIRDRINTSDPTEDDGGLFYLVMKYVAVVLFIGFFVTVGPMVREYRLVRWGVPVDCEITKYDMTKIPPISQRA
jgi:hypothetical protein